MVIIRLFQDFTHGYSIIVKSTGTHLSSYPQPGLEERAAFAGDDVRFQIRTFEIELDGFGLWFFIFMVSDFHFCLELIPIFVPCRTLGSKRQITFDRNGGMKLGGIPPLNSF